MRNGQYALCCPQTHQGLKDLGVRGSMAVSWQCQRRNSPQVTTEFSGSSESWGALLYVGGNAPSLLWGAAFYVLSERVKQISEEEDAGIALSPVRLQNGGDSYHLAGKDRVWRQGCSVPHRQRCIVSVPAEVEANCSWAAMETRTDQDISAKSTISQYLPVAEWVKWVITKILSTGYRSHIWFWV